MEKHSAFAPFKHKTFAVLWIATLISNIGTWMFNITSGWLMTDLSPSPLMVAMTQAATTLPIFLFALPAGALGDLFDRRKLLLISQLFLAAALFVFAAILWQGSATPWLLIFFTFLTGTGAAFAMPAWQAIVPRLVPASELSSAIALNGVSINIARAIGPAIGGFILLTAGAVATVALDALSYIVIAMALLWWRYVATADEKALPREHLVGAMGAGVRYALRSTPLRNTLVRAFGFFIFASAYWALLPLIARDLLKGGPDLYGILLTGLGLGAVGGTFLLPIIRRYLNAGRILVLATAGTGFSMVLFGYGGSIPVGIFASGLAGVSWILAISSLNVSAQMALPDWVRARGLAIFQMAFFGAMTIGALGWGQLAGMVGLSSTLGLAAVLGILLMPVLLRFVLDDSVHHDHTPSRHWVDPVLYIPVTHDQGPVLITVEYQIDDAGREEFYTLIRVQGSIRRREGAAQWGFFEDVEKPGRIIEMFTAESWVAHLRHHQRISAADKVVQDKILALHRGSTVPVITHAVTPETGKKPRKLPKYHHDV